MPRLTVGVVGGAGHSGGEVCRLLLGHPAVARVLPTSRGDEPFERLHRNLLGSGLSFVTPSALEERANELDVVFFCTPSGEAMRSARAYLDAGATVIDLSADFRFPDPAEYEEVYGRPHEAPDLLRQAVWGITEHYRDRIKGARLVSNPGCYVITAVLGLAPLLSSDLVDLSRPINLSAVNGTTGAGATPRRETLHAEAFGSMLPYSLEGHRHTPELEQVLSDLAGRQVAVDMSTAHGAFARGIHIQASLAVDRAARDDVDRDRLLEVLRAAHGAGHGGNHFVLVNDFAKQGSLNAKEYDAYPSLAAVRGSNYCHVGVDYAPRHGIAKVVAVTDNLVKGAAGSALQNMNVALGLDETAGLRGYGC